MLRCTDGHQCARCADLNGDTKLDVAVVDECRITDVRVLYAREIFTRLFRVAKLLKILVARDGIEPPTPAFSGPLTESPKWFEINGCY
jgi:hypothetical protein